MPFRLNVLVTLMLGSRTPSWSECKIVFGSLLALNALVRLASYWSVRIKSVTAFKPCADWRGATHCKVCDAEVCYTPALLVPHALCSVQVVPGTFAGKKSMVELQRRTLVRYQSAYSAASVGVLCT